VIVIFSRTELVNENHLFAGKQLYTADGEFLNDVLKPRTSVQAGDTVTNPLCEAF
jgi:hypothetical protein